MKNKNQRLISIILISLSCLLFIIAIVLLLNTTYFEFNNKIENEDNNQSQLKEENNNSNNDQSDKEIDMNNNSESSNTEVENNTSTESNNNVVEESNPKKEENVISYFESQDNMITATSNQEDSSLRSKAKNAFVTIVDFIFYDKEIKGYTFKELTTSAKLKVIKLALSIDHKIDEYFPDYKEVIKDKYNDIKGKLAVKYLEFTSTLCETVGEDTCNQAKEDFNTMKESFGFTWQLIKELASSGSEKIKEFYESWRDSE